MKKRSFLKGLLGVGLAAPIAAVSASPVEQEQDVIPVIKESLDEILERHVFEVNDGYLRTKVKHDITSFLKGVAAAGKIKKESITVVCDETNNSPGRINNGELHAYIALQQTGQTDWNHISVCIQSSVIDRDTMAAVRPSIRPNMHDNNTGFGWSSDNTISVGIRS